MTAAGRMLRQTVALAVAAVLGSPLHAARARRRLMALAAAVATLAGPLPALAQPPAGAGPRVGVLLFTPLTDTVQEGLRQGLREHGYVEGQNIRIEWRSAEGRPDRAAALAAELVRLDVDVIVAEFTPAAIAARNATRTIPIVMAPAGEPVAMGLVESLARPGGNVTGFSNIAAELSGKRLELLRELVPGLARVGLLIHGADPLDRAFVDETRAAAARDGIHLHVAGVPRPQDLAGALAAMARERVGAVIVQGNLPAPSRQVAQAVARHRLPSISPLTQFVEAGGLMSYGPSLGDIQRRAAAYVDKLLRGAKAADLPVERPTKFELVVNRKTARALGITVPPALLLRADRVID